MKLGLFSISYAGLWGQAALDLPAFIARAGQLGFETVMLAGKRPHLAPLDWSPERAAEIRAALEETGVGCSVIAGYTDFAGGPATEVPFVEMQVAYVESLARIAADLGAKIVRVFTAYDTSPDGLLTPRLWSTVVSALRECADRAAAHGVTIAVQNHHDVALHTDALLELLNEVGRSNCKLAFDAWSPALRGEDLYESARRAAPHMVLTTNADYVRVPRYQYRPSLVNYERAFPDWVRAVPFGEGFIDYPSFFTGLRDGGYTGPAVYEMCSSLRGGGSIENLDAYATAYRSWMTEHVAVTSR